MMSSQSSLLWWVSWAVFQVWSWSWLLFLSTYASVKVRFSSQVMMGRLRRSLYVGRIIEYLFPLALGAIVRDRVANVCRECTGVVGGECFARG